MVRKTLTVDNWTYEGVDAHRTLLLLGELWQHHVHGRAPSQAVQQRSAEALAALFAPLACADDASLAPAERVAFVGSQAAERIDDLDPPQLEHALREMWKPLAALAEKDATHPAEPSSGVVAGLFLSNGGVPKLSADSVQVGYGGVHGDRQASRQHHGRPWQALCLWSADVAGELARAGHPIRPGSAGENVSLRGINWNAVRPGVRLMLGEVTVRLSAYAIPCSKNARWFSDGDYERLSHERPEGSRVYAIVETPGLVAVGDHVHVVV